jgi:hypothetical protein
MVAYSSISHMGIVLLGIATLNVTGLTGAVMQMVAHGLTAGLLFLIVGLLYQRTHSRDLADYGSLLGQSAALCLFRRLRATGRHRLAGQRWLHRRTACAGGWLRALGRLDSDRLSRHADRLPPTVCASSAACACPARRCNWPT